MLQSLCTRAFEGDYVIWLYVFEESPMKVKKKKPERDAQAFFCRIGRSRGLLTLLHLSLQLGILSMTHNR
jgi:hypothetical protein